MKQDRKRISKERHEIAYNRKLARKWINGPIKRLISNEGLTLINTIEYPEDYELQRICKALIKYTNGYTRVKRK